jgi:membrane-associated protein
LWSFLVVVSWAVLANVVSAQESSASGSERGFWTQLVEILLTFDSRGMLNLLSRPEFEVAAFLALNLIVFVETGLLIGFFLPGDSLLVTAGIVCKEADWNLPLLLTSLSLAAIIGDSLGYSIGFKTGPKIFNREKSLLFNRDHLLAAQAFYQKHGGKTIILARFVPIIRTFAPVVAGVGRMEYRRFLLYNVIGGVGWVVSLILLGYIMTWAIDPIFKDLLGYPNFEVRNHIEKVIIIVVLLSISPGMFVWLKNKLKGKQPQPELVGK